MTIDNMLDEILLQVKRPGRYLGNEWNVVKKGIRPQDIKFAICFPDLYEVGMSHLGLRIIYGLLNAEEGVACERVFLPDIDMQHILKAKDMPLFSLESRLPLGDFDFIGFCLNYELDYTNVLAVLDLARIPLLAKDRTLDFPLVIAGGCCTSNPEPLADFIDLFLIGEAEEALPQIIEAYKNFTADGGKSTADKEGILRELAKIEGVYVPSFYDVGYDKSGVIKSFIPRYPDTPGKIKKRIVKNLDEAYYPTQWLVPYIQIVHDRAAVELMRGCPHSCKFCQAGNFYRYQRMRSPSKILELISKICKSTGYEEISLLSLSTSDYPHLPEIVSSLSGRFQENAVAISLPSLRPRSYLGGIVEYLSRVHKTTLTFAPEAGSERLRRLINKNFDMEELYSAVLNAYRAGWQAVKLYFMIGLPYETKDDLDGILEIARKVSNLRRELGKPQAGVNLSISSFIPKPHTYFQKEGMASLEILEEKRRYLKEESKGLPKVIKLAFHNPQAAFLEAVFSRGDRRLGRVLLTAYQNGCFLDGWPEYFKFDIWKEAFRVNELDTEFYLKQKADEERLPWQHIDLGVDSFRAQGHESNLGEAFPQIQGNA